MYQVDVESDFFFKLFPSFPVRTGNVAFVTNYYLQIFNWILLKDLCDTS